MIKQQNYNQGLLDFIGASPTPFHAVDSMRDTLLEAGFVELSDSQKWQLQPAGRYFVTRNASSIIAFIMGQQPASKFGIRMVGAHTDSPCLKVKPQPEIKKNNYFQILLLPMEQL